MLFTETLFVTFEIFIYLSSFSFFLLDVFEAKLIVVIFFLSQMGLYVLLMLAGMVQSLFGTSMSSGHRSTRNSRAH